MEKVNPYYYKIKHKGTLQYYFGSRFRNKLPAASDLICKYQTSSTFVKELGIENFIIEEIIEFDSYEDAFLYEQKMIKDNKKDPLILNRHYMDPKTLSKEYFKSTKGLLKGRTSPTKGMKFTEETKKKMSGRQILRGGNGPKKHKDESKKKISDSLKGHPGAIWSEKSKQVIRDLRASEPDYTCDRCGHNGRGKSAMKRWHFENCRNN